MLTNYTTKVSLLELVLCDRNHTAWDFEKLKIEICNFIPGYGYSLLGLQFFQ